MAEICVTVPVYRVEPYLRRCVDSILAQSWQDFTLILVDDGSPDTCGAICEDYAARDSRIHVIHQENGGLSAARNAGIDWAFAHSDCRWLAFVDSDDWIHPDFLRALYEAANGAGCLLSACAFQRTSGEPLDADQDTRAQVLDADGYYCGAQSGFAPVAWNKLYHRSLFASVRYPVGKLHEDEFTTYRLVYQSGKVAATSARLYAYYQNPQGITGSKWNPRRLDVLEALDQQAAFAREQGNDRLLCQVVEQTIFTLHENLSQADRPYRRDLRRRYRRALKQGKICGVFPKTEASLWAYEEAYPCRLYWWLRLRLSRGGKL